MPRGVLRVRRSGERRRQQGYPKEGEWVSGVARVLRRRPCGRRRRSCALGPAGRRAGGRRARPGSSGSRPSAHATEAGRPAGPVVAIPVCRPPQGPIRPWPATSAPRLRRGASDLGADSLSDRRLRAAPTGHTSREGRGGQGLRWPGGPSAARAARLVPDQHVGRNAEAAPQAASHRQGQRTFAGQDLGNARPAANQRLQVLAGQSWLLHAKADGRQGVGRVEWDTHRKPLVPRAGRP